MIQMLKNPVMVGLRKAKSKGQIKQRFSVLELGKWRVQVHPDNQIIFHFMCKLTPKIYLQLMPMSDLPSEPTLLIW